jgi:beta-aspartyl-dipeptidase (metallo-type)
VRELMARGHGLDRILPAFTSNVATLLRLPQKGALRVGADADLVVLDAEHRVRDVMARGSWHIQGGMTVRRGTFETA